MRPMLRHSSDKMKSSGHIEEEDRLRPWLLRVKESLETKEMADFNKHVSDCVLIFKHDACHKEDPRFLRIWLLNLEISGNGSDVLRELEDCESCSQRSVLFELCAGWLEAKEEWAKAHHVYQLGISRKAQPLARLKDAFALFLLRISHRTSRLQKVGRDEPGTIPRSDDTPLPACTGKLSNNLTSQHDKCESNSCNVVIELERSKFFMVDENQTIEPETVHVNPWSACATEEFSKKINLYLKKCVGFNHSNKVYRGDSLSSLRKECRNKKIRLGSKIYHIKGCAGQGAFAQVFKAYDESNPNEIVALKMQSPPFPLEFYMYRQLDYRIAENKRSIFGYAHSMHVYTNCSILMCNFYPNGTLQDVVNSYVVVGKFMEEVLCIFYTVEMLYILEILHASGIIHGDFKPDNLVIRHSRNVLIDDEYCDRQGAWTEQGLCLLDWGRAIDLNLFPPEVSFEGDCRTSGFRCVQMQERRPWKYQVDTYGLCAGVHLMLHNSYMKIVKKPTADGGYLYQPTAPFKRYWNVELWTNLFTQLLNYNNLDTDVEMLQNLRKGFQDYLSSNKKLLNQLKQLLVKSRQALCSA